MATYYVSSAGLDTNSGTSTGSPFLTIGKAVTVAVQGDTINLNGGNSFTENPSFSVGVTIQSYGTGQATIIGGTSPAIKFVNCSNWTVNNLILTNSYVTYVSGTPTGVVQFVPTLAGTYGNIKITNCIITGCLQATRIVAGSTSVIIHGVVISGCTMTGVLGGPAFGGAGTFGTNFQLSDILITNNNIGPMVGYSAGGGGGVGFQYANTLYGPVIVSNNVFHDMGASTGVGATNSAFAFQCEGCEGIQVFGNLAYNLYNFNLSADGGNAYDLDLDSKNCSVYNNYAYNCDGPGLSCYSLGSQYTGNVFHNNICVNVARNTPFGGIYIEGTTPYTFVNNTIITHGTSALFIGVGINPTATLLNNCFITSLNVPTVNFPAGISTAGLTMDGNYHQSGNGNFACTSGNVTYTSIAAWRAVTGLEPNGIGGGNCYLNQPQPSTFITSVNIPSLIDYSPVSGTPLVSAGVNISGVYGALGNTDPFGNLWNNTIGAIYPPQPSLLTPYAAALYADNPLSWFRLAETSGIYLYDTIGSLPAQFFVSGVMGKQTLTPGDGGSSTLFNGQSMGFIFQNRFPTSGINFRALSFEAWILPSSVGSSDYLLHSFSTVGTANIITYSLTNSGLRLATRDSTSVNQVVSTASGFTAFPNKLYHIISTWSGNVHTHYINGVSYPPFYTAQAASLPSGIQVSSLFIGNTNTSEVFYDAGNNWFTGLIGNLAIYNTVLSSGRSLAHYNAGKSTAYSLTGSEGAIPNIATNLTLTPFSSGNDLVTFSSSVPSDVITPSSVSFSYGSFAVPSSIQIVGSAVGWRNITATSASGLNIQGSSFLLDIATPFTVSCSSVFWGGSNTKITYTPSGVANDILTPNDNNAGGGFNPPSLVFSGTGALTSEYMPPIYPQGPIIFGATTSGNAVVFPASGTCYEYVVDVYVSKWGKTIFVVANSEGMGNNNNYTPVGISQIISSPTFEVNGNVIQTGPPIFNGGQQFAAFLAQCGGVQQLHMVNAGISGYVTPYFSWDGSSGSGTGLVLANGGSGTTLGGILSYNIVNSGSSFVNSFAIYIPGQSPSVQACAWVNVVSGAVTSVLPLTGSPLAYGAGYTGSLTGVVLNGVNATGFDINALEWVNNSNTEQAGNGLVVNCVIGNYVVPPAVLNTGSGFLSPPNITITDLVGNGFGATCIPVMTGPLSTDVVTYSTSAHWIKGTLNGFDNFDVAPTTNNHMDNWVGQTEGRSGRAIGFKVTPTMAAGGNAGYQTSIYNIYFTGKNKLNAGQVYKGYLNTTYLTLDSNYYPQFWTPNTWITNNFYSNDTYNGSIINTLAEATGVWTLQYDDDFLSGLSSTPSFCNIGLPNGGGQDESLSVLTSGPFTTLPVTGVVTISSNQVTGITLSNSGAGLQGVYVNIQGGGGNGSAAWVATVSGGSITKLTKLYGGQSYTSTPSVQLVPISVSGTAVTLKFQASYTQPNIGGNISLVFGIVSNSDGTQHVHNPWIFAPNNTIDRSKPLATDDVVVANLTNNGRGPGVLRFMESVGGAINAMVANPTDILNPNLASWDPYFNTGQSAPPGPGNSPVFTGNLIPGSAIITGIPNTSILKVGQALMGTGIPVNLIGEVSVPFITINTIDSPTQITMSGPVYGSGTQYLSVNSSPAGNILFNAYRPYNINPSSIYSWYTPKIYSPESWANTGTDSFGSYLDITNGPNGINDNGNFITGGPNKSNGLVELLCNTAHGITTGFSALQGFSSLSPYTGILTNGSNLISGVSLIYQLTPGMSIAGIGIPAGAMITGVTTNSILLNENVTTNGTQALTSYNTVTFNNGGGTWQWPNGAISGTAPGGFFWVTGPSSVVVAMELPAGAGANQNIVGSSVIPMYLPWTINGCNMQLPFEYCAAMCANWPNTTCWVNVPFNCSDATVTSIAQRIYANIGTTNNVVMEMGNEHWQVGDIASLEHVWETIMANATSYYPSGTQLYQHYTPSGTTAFYITNGQAMPGGGNAIDMAYTIRAAAKGYAFKSAWIATGGDPSRVKIIYGGFYNTPSLATTVINTIVNNNLPQDYYAVAPYVGSLNTATTLTVLPAGYAGNSNAMDWTVDACNEYEKHYLRYGTNLTSVFSELSQQLTGTTIQVAGYEGGVTNLMTWAPFYNQVNEDSFYHASFADVVQGHFLGNQIGHPNYSGGMTLYNYFSLYNNVRTGPTWKLADGSNQSMAGAIYNQFVTPQGGSPGTGNSFGYYQTNAAPGLSGLFMWIGATSGTINLATNVFFDAGPNVSFTGSAKYKSTSYLQADGDTSFSLGGTFLINSTASLDGSAVTIFSAGQSHNSNVSLISDSSFYPGNKGVFKVGTPSFIVDSTLGSKYAAKYGDTIGLNNEGIFSSKITTSGAIGNLTITITINDYRQFLGAPSTRTVIII